MVSHQECPAEEREYPRPASETRLIYERHHYEKIAAAIGKPLDAVEAHARAFEAAARLYQQPDFRAGFLKPSEGRKRLLRISSAAKRLLDALGVQDAAEAPDGPSPEVMFLLNFADSADEDAIVNATERLGRLVVMLQGIKAATTISPAAAEAAEHIIRIGQLIVPKGNQAGRTSHWVDSLASIYEKITGRPAGMSVKPATGEAGGPFLRFLVTAGAPLGIEESPQALRSLFRGVLARSQK